MGIYKKDRNYFIDYRFEGRRIRQRIGENRKLAIDVLRKKKLEIAEGRFLDIKKQERIRFSDFAGEFLDTHCKPHKKSWKDDYYNLEYFKRYFRDKCLHEITTQDIEKFKMERLKENAPASVNRQLATLKTMFHKAIVWNKLEKNPAKNIQFFKEPQGRLQYLEQAEITRLVSNCSDKLRPIVITALHTGMRRGEIFDLQWRDVDMEKQIIRVVYTKNNDVKIIPIDEQLKETLKDISRHPKSPYVFCDENGKRYHDIRKSFFTALKKSGIIGFRFHDLRHTFASQLAMAGVDLNSIRVLMGHRDLRMTLRYAHLSPSYQREAISKLNQKMDTQVDTFWTLSPVSETPEKLANSQPLKDIKVR